MLPAMYLIAVWQDEVATDDQQGLRHQSSVHILNAWVFKKRIAQRGLLGQNLENWTTVIPYCQIKNKYYVVQELYKCCTRLHESIKEHLSYMFSEKDRQV